MTDLVQQLFDAKVVSILRHVPYDKLPLVLSALHDSRVKLVEVTLNSKDALKMIGEVAADGRFLVGAGTVLDSESAKKAISAGAKFIISPNLKKEVILAAQESGALSIPGVMTPTEMIQALEWGADIVKVFPASTLGPSYFRAIRGPIGDAKLMATGGIHSENIKSFIDAGVNLFGIGGGLVSQKALNRNDWDKIREDSRIIMDALKHKE